MLTWRDNPRPQWREYEKRYKALRFGLGDPAWEDTAKDEEGTAQPPSPETSSEPSTVHNVNTELTSTSSSSTSPEISVGDVQEGAEGSHQDSTLPSSTNLEHSDEAETTTGHAEKSDLIIGGGEDPKLSEAKIKLLLPGTEDISEASVRRVCEQIEQDLLEKEERFQTLHDTHGVNYSTFSHEEADDPLHPSAGEGFDPNLFEEDPDEDEGTPDEQAAARVALIKNLRVELGEAPFIIPETAKSVDVYEVGTRRRHKTPIVPMELVMPARFTPNHHAPIQLDTGAAVSLMSLSTFHKLPHHEQYKIDSRVLRLKDVQGQEIPQPIRPRRIRLQVGGVWITHTFHIVEQAERTLGGLDLMTAHSFLLAMSPEGVRCEMRKRGQKPVLIGASMGNGEVVSVDNVKVFPYTKTNIWVTHNCTEVKDGEDFEIQAKENLDPLLIDNTLQRGNEHNRYVMQLWNPGTELIVVKRGTPLGQVVRFDPGNVICSLTDTQVIGPEVNVSGEGIRINSVLANDDEHGTNTQDPMSSTYPQTQGTDESDTARTQAKHEDEPAGYDIPEVGDLPQFDNKKTITNDPHIPKTIRSDFLNFIENEVPEVISKNELDYGTLRLGKDEHGNEIDSKMHIDLMPHDQPVSSKGYQLNALRHQQLRKSINRLVEAGLLRESDSPYTSPAFLIRKKADRDGVQMTRLIFDYRGINKITKKRHFPLPIIKNLMTSLAHKQYYTTIDLRSAYHNLELSPEAQEVAAVISAGSVYKPTRCVFGLTGAPSKFQEVMHHVLKGVPNTYAYLDDIVVATPKVDGDSERAHLEDVKTLLRRLREVGLKIHLGKCEFFRKSIRFLGKILSREGTKPLPEHVKAIREFPAPRNFTDMQRFNGLINFLSSFVNNYSTLMNPLYKVLHRKVFSWTTEDNDAFEAVKRAVAEDTILYHPDFEAPMYLTTDACHDSHGAILYQVVTYREKDLPILRKNLHRPEVLDELAQKQYHPVLPAKGVARVPKLTNITGEEHPETILPYEDRNIPLEPEDDDSADTEVLGDEGFSDYQQVSAAINRVRWNDVSDEAESGLPELFRASGSEDEGFGSEAGDITESIQPNPGRSCPEKVEELKDPEQLSEWAATRVREMIRERNQSHNTEMEANITPHNASTRKPQMKNFHLDRIAKTPGCVHVVRVIAYYSGVFRGPALHYSILEKEAVGLIRALEHFRDELYAAKHAYVVSDSQAFLFLLRFQNMGLSRVERLCVRLLQIEYRIIVGFMKGEHMASDALTRVYKIDEGEATGKKKPNYKKAIVVASPFKLGQVITVEDIVKALETDPDLVLMPEDEQLKKLRADDAMALMQQVRLMESLPWVPDQEDLPKVIDVKDVESLVSREQQVAFVTDRKRQYPSAETHGACPPAKEPKIAIVAQVDAETAVPDAEGKASRPPPSNIPANEFAPLNDLREMLTTTQLQKEQRRDGALRPLIRLLLIPESQRTQAQNKQCHLYTLDRGLLKKRYVPRNINKTSKTARTAALKTMLPTSEQHEVHDSPESVYRIVVPKTLIGPLIAYYHYANHSGGRSLAQTIAMDYAVPNLQQRATDFSNSCHLCAVYQQSPSPAQSLGVTPIPLAKAMEWHIDLVTGLPKVGSYDAYLSMCDRYSNFRISVPISSTITGRRIAELVELHILQGFGLIKKLYSDMERRMTPSVDMKRLADLYGFELQTMTPYNPKGHPIEAVHKYTTILLAKLRDSFPHIPWPRLLSLAVLALNAKPSRRLANLTPYEVMFGKRSELWHPQGTSEGVIIAPTEQMTVFRQIHDLMSEINVEEEQKRKAENLKRGGTMMIYPPRSFCYVRDNRSDKLHPKIKPKYYPSPRQVLLDYDHTVLVRDFWGQTSMVHKDHIKPCKARDVEDFQNLPLSVKRTMGSPFSPEELERSFELRKIPDFWEELRRGQVPHPVRMPTRASQPIIPDPLSLLVEPVPSTSSAPVVELADNSVDEYEPAETTPGAVSGTSTSAGTAAEDDGRRVHFKDSA